MPPKRGDASTVRVRRPIAAVASWQARHPLGTPSPRGPWHDRAREAQGAPFLHELRTRLALQWDLPHGGCADLGGRRVALGGEGDFSSA